MLTTDARCHDQSCAHKGIYRMIGRCYNCKAEPVLVLFTEGHEAYRVKCPTCRVRDSVNVSRLATEDEIPEAVAERTRGD